MGDRNKRVVTINGGALYSLFGERRRVARPQEEKTAATKRKEREKKQTVIAPITSCVLSSLSSPMVGVRVRSTLTPPFVSNIFRKRGRRNEKGKEKNQAKEGKEEREETPGKRRKEEEERRKRMRKM